MFLFATRPGYRSAELLIEFRKATGTEERIRALWDVLEGLGAKVAQVCDLWRNDEVLYRRKSEFGEFELSHDTWGGRFILARKNPEAIPRIKVALLGSGRFEKVEVDFEAYG